MIGGERQFRRNMKLITENYLWKGGQGVVTGGVRFFGERLSADIETSRAGRSGLLPRGAAGKLRVHSS